MKSIVYIPDIECDSCTRLISKKFQNLEGINDFEFKSDHMVVDYEGSKVKIQEIINSIKEVGFRASLNPFERKTFKERIRDFNQNGSKYEVEMKGITYSIALFFLLLVLELLAYLVFFKNIPNFLQNYGMWIFYLNLSISSLGFAIWHIYSYKSKVTCMIGMMLGMTIGMQTGMMLGAIIGATNGFFIGAMTGMLLGVFVGILTGRLCGIMGIMEGMMAGLMGGTMGPMITLMMLSDHIVWFMPFYIIINMVILLGLSYMLYEELVEYKQVQKQPANFIRLALPSILVASFLLLIMVYGPKSAAILSFFQ